MNRILIVGCGDIAMRVASLLQRKPGRYRLLGLIRNPTRSSLLRNAGITPVPGNLDSRISLNRLAGLAHTVLHFAPPSGEAKSDTRTRNLLSALSHRTLPRHFIYISTSGVYGDCAGRFVSETHPLNPQTARAQLRVDAEQQIRNWAKLNGVHAIILRVPGIYAQERLPLERLRAGTAAIVHQEDSYTNHIHADDLAHCVIAALRYGRPNRVIHTCDDSTMKMGEYFDAVADAFSLPHPARLPRQEVQREVSPVLWSFMNESRRLTNTRMKRELKVRLRYPEVADGLKLQAEARPDAPRRTR